MRLVVDANVIISALAKDGGVRAALRTSTDEILTPEYVYTELDAHRREILDKSGLSDRGFNALIQNLFQRVEVVPREKMVPKLQNAARVMRSHDPDDAFYVAAALAVDAGVVSNDRAFEKQQAVPHMWTSEFVERALGQNNENA